MIASRAFFIALSALVSLVGLAAAAWARDYLHVFGLGLFGFGALYVFGAVRRHFEEQEGRAEP